MKSISIVLPCHNEQEVLSDTYNELKSLIDLWLGKIITDYQIVIVNNGSTDNTLNEALKLKKIDSKLKIIDLRNNYGYQSSITAGLLNSNNDLVISIDADLQDDPSMIEEMIKLNYQGYEMVLGVRKDRKSDNFFKRISANLFYKLLIYLNINVVPNHGDFRLLSKDLILELSNYKEINRFLRAIIMLLDNNYATVSYSRRKRQKGKTKFDLKNLISLSFDAITSFSPNPIRAIFIIGLFTFLFSLFFIAVIFINYFINGLDIRGWSSLASLILFFGGLQLISISFIGEYISKSYLESKKRPLYLIRKIY